MFIIPNHCVICKIEKNAAYNKNIKMEVAAKSLLKKVDDLLSLFFYFKSNTSLVKKRNKIWVNLYVPPFPLYPLPVLIVIYEPNYTFTKSALWVLLTNELIINVNNFVNKNMLAQYKAN